MTDLGAPCLVGIDVGSQSAKVVVHDAAGAVLAQGRTPLRPPHTPAPGVVEHPDDDLWDALASACRSALAPLGERRADIAAVGLCGVRFCRALMRADGSLAAPVLSWMDDRVARPYEHHDDAVAKVAAVSGYLTTRLTGELRDSVASYRGAWPVDLEAWSWLGDDDLPAFGLERDRLLELVQPGEVLGRLTTGAAEATGLPVGAPVVATANDKAVEALGAGLRSADDLLVSLGTYVAAMTVGTVPRRDDVACWTNFGAEPGVYLHESGGIRRGMWTVSWLVDLVGGPGQGPADLESAAAGVPAGSDGLLALLDWLPPVDEPWRRGALVGLDVRHGPGHLYRAVLEALALTVHGHARRMTAELGTSPGRVLLSGGGAASPLLSQVVADVFALPTESSSAPSAAALGAAVSAAVGVGVHPSFAAAVAAMGRPGSRREPSPDRQTYAALHGRHEQLAAALEPVLRASSRLS